MTNSSHKKSIYLLLPLFLLCSVVFYSCGRRDTTEWNFGEPINPEYLQIAIIYLDETIGGYSRAHDKGLEKAIQSIGLREEQVIRKFNVIDAYPIMSEYMITEAITEGANVVIATSWGYMDVIEKLAARYPHVVFAHATGIRVNNRNFTNYYGRIYQARYLSGIVAGMQTQTNKIGYVAAMDVTDVQVTSGLNAFARGVYRVNPEAEVLVKVTYNWVDKEGERAAAERLIAEGCDVITQHSDTFAPQLAAEEAGVWGIGYNIDMSDVVEHTVLTSVVWNWDVYYTRLLRSIINGTFTTEPYMGGLEDGLVNLVDLDPQLSTPEIQEAVSQAKRELLSGRIQVFEGRMKTNLGSYIEVVDGVPSEQEIINTMNWYLHNIRVIRE